MSRLAVLHMGTDGEPGADPHTHVAHQPSYVPYESSEVPRHEAGESMFRRTVGAVYSSEVGASVGASPLAATALVTAASLRSELWLNHGSRTGARLSVLAEAVPRKGGEIAGLLAEYCSRNAREPALAVPMAIRDFYAAIYSLQFIRSSDARLLDLCGSALCLTSAVDFVGSSDDAGGAGLAAYAVAAGEGLGCLGGAGTAQVLRDIVLTDTLMKAKDAMATTVAGIADLEGFVSRCGGPVTPEEFLTARWWDAAMPPYHRLVGGTAAYKHLTDDLGSFRAADSCGWIKRAIDSLIRYDEMIDLISDYVHGECFNEALVAVAVGGSDALLGYGNAVAAVTHEVLACGCGAPGHEEAAEMAMGGCLYYLLAPRWMMRRQLAGLTAAGGEVAGAFAWPPPGERLKAVVRTALRPGHTLHSASWQRLWDTPVVPSPGPEPAWVDELAHRAARRALLPDAGEGTVIACEKAAESVLIDCDRLTDPDDLRALGDGWCRLFDAALDSLGEGSMTSRHPAARVLRAAIGRLWQHIVVGPPDTSEVPGDRSDDQLFFDVDHALRQTYALPPTEGLVVRRAFLGTATSAVELSGLNPYGRLADGVARHCRVPAASAAAVATAADDRAYCSR
ncbi:hypothetical protein [Streptomyces sp. NPDC059185]|uniref:hypothetical protein n=1 Tax=Streptomyces sp. NPDC059185 TaxID=3346762 RepID=UPI003697A0B7